MQSGEKMAVGRLLALYADRRMAKIFLLGFISGFPWVLIASMLSLWLSEEEVSRTGIGLFGLLFATYAVNACWAPLVDRVSIPLLSARFGRRRAWILLMQGVIALAMVGLFLLPGAADYRWWVALLAFAIALASATQDIAIDATRIEMIGPDEPEKIGAGSAMATSGWWMGFGGSKVAALPLVQWLQEMGVEKAWQVGYLSLVAVVGVCAVLLVLFIRPTAAQQEEEKESTAGLMQVLVNPVALYAEPLRAFVVRFTLKPAILLLLFIIFFKIGEAFLGRMSLIFYKEIGFSKSEIALLSGGLGTATVCLFAVFGSLFNARYGLARGIILGGIAMALTNLLFAALAYHPERWLFVTAVVSDQFTTSVSTVAFVAFLSQLCDRRHTATHYAALASLGNLSRTVFAAGSGALVDGLHATTGGSEMAVASGAWALFFAITVAMVLPSLIILQWVRPYIASLLRGATTRVL